MIIILYRSFLGYFFEGDSYFSFFFQFYFHDSWVDFWNFEAFFDSFLPYQIDDSLYSSEVLRWLFLGFISIFFWSFFAIVFYMSREICTSFHLMAIRTHLWRCWNSFYSVNGLHMPPKVFRSNAYMALRTCFLLFWLHNQ